MATWYDLILPFFDFLGWTPADYLLFLSVLSGLLFGAADYRIALMSCLLIFIAVASFFIFYGFDTLRAFLLIFSCIVIMAISLYVERSQKTGGFI